jgi:HSP20 family protein
MDPRASGRKQDPAARRDRQGLIGRLRLPILRARTGLGTLAIARRADRRHRDGPGRLRIQRKQDPSYASRKGIRSMHMRDLIPWARGSSEPLEMYRGDQSSPFLAFHREMNRLFDEAFRGFDMPTFLGARPSFVYGQWPKLEVMETEKEIRVMAELPGVEENEVEISLSDGTLIIRGERKSEIDDKDRQFSERFYGHFERHIPVGMDVEEDKVEASFRNGMLEITLPKTERAKAKARRIAINAPIRH